MLQFFKKLFGSKHERDVEDLFPLVDEINSHIASLQQLSDEELREKTTEFRQRIHDRTKEIEDEIAQIKVTLKQSQSFEEHEALYSKIDELNKRLDEEIEAVLNEILPEAFAVVKDTCRRLVGQTWDVAGNKIVWDMVPFDVQLMGGVALHKGKIAEMATGEGKTLVATMPTYLNALPGRGVHIVTVNDYLALRDSLWMGKVFEFLGLKVACILQNMDPHQRRIQYAADITYGTNNEFGFDYLRDNMVVSAEDMVQRPYNYAIATNRLLIQTSSSSPLELPGNRE